MDENGYPTDDELEMIEKYDTLKNGVSGLLDILEELWYYDAPYFFRDGGVLVLHTGGWSGNESIIDALQKNYFWFFYWQKSERGGHYYFEIPKDHFATKEA